MQVGKTKIAGTSMMVLTIDNEIPDTVMQQIINLDGIFDAKTCKLLYSLINFKVKALGFFT